MCNFICHLVCCIWKLRVKSSFNLLVFFNRKIHWRYKILKINSNFLSFYCKSVSFLVCSSQFDVKKFSKKIVYRFFLSHNLFHTFSDLFLLLNNLFTLVINRIDYYIDHRLLSLETSNSNKLSKVKSIWNFLFRYEAKSYSGEKLYFLASIFFSYELSPVEKLWLNFLQVLWILSTLADYWQLVCEFF